MIVAMTVAVMQVGRVVWGTTGFSGVSVVVLVEEVIERAEFVHELADVGFGEVGFFRGHCDGTFGKVRAEEAVLFVELDTGRR